MFELKLKLNKKGNWLAVIFQECKKIACFYKLFKIRHNIADLSFFDKAIASNRKESQPWL
jgi:hypothetical protein